MDESAILRVVAHRHAERITCVEVLNHEIPAAEPLVGRGVQEARRFVLETFDPSAQAHAAALAAAWGAAQGRAPAGEDDAVRVERTVAAEAAQEHVCRLLEDWPPLFGHAVLRHHFADLHRRLGQIRDEHEAFGVGGELLDLLANELLSGFYGAFRGPNTLAEFVAMARRGGTMGSTLADLIELGAYVPPEEVCAPLLPCLPAAEWASELSGLPGAGFCRAPVRQGRAYETGALPRQEASPLVATLLAQGHRIAARLFARVQELGDCASRLRHPLPPDLPPLVDAAPLGEGCGLARVETGEGLLLHAVRLKGEQVAEYAIVVPAAWNFHPDGPLAREARGRPAADRDLALLRLRALVLALDPGCDFEVALEDGEGSGAY